jgi:hypothetical protein
MALGTNMPPGFSPSGVQTDIWHTKLIFKPFKNTSMECPVAVLV